MKWVLVRPSSFRLPRYNLVRKRVTDSKFFSLLNPYGPNWIIYTLQIIQKIRDQ